MYSATTIWAKLQHYLENSYRLDKQREIAVLLSGGVDSSVVLASLQHYGCTNLAAYYLKIWLEEDAQFLGNCPWEQDLTYAAAVCKQLGVALHVVPLQGQYYDYVVSYTIEELRRGRTPSPDLFCNQFVKFGCFMQRLQQNTEQHVLIASGHYALLIPASQGMLPSQGTQFSHYLNKPTSAEFLLRQAPDAVKDQSYFLARLRQHQLQNLLFPLGCLHKAEVRHLAKEWGLATAQRKDSQGICFLGKIKFGDFAAHYLGKNPGPIIDVDTDTQLGQHNGLWFHTIGQRQGLGLGGGPWYVCSKNLDTNCLYVRHARLQQQHEAGFCSFWVEPPQWITEGPANGIPEGLLRELASESLSDWGDALDNSVGDSFGPLQLKLRHGPSQVPCQIERIEGKWRVLMQQPDRGIAPGQFAVFYWGNICLGSAAILQLEFSPPCKANH